MLKYKARNYKTLRGKRRILFDINHSKAPDGCENKNKWDLLKLKRFYIDLLMICQEQHLLQVIVDHQATKDGQMSGTDCVNGWGS